MTGPRVSVVLPTHDRAALVGRAVESVLAQSFRDLELIVVDDASSDETPAVLDRFAADPRVRIHRNARNLGAAGARNAGIRLARGELVAFQDSDDLWLPDKLAAEIALADRLGGEVAVYCGAIYWSPEDCYYIPIPGSVAAVTGDLSRAILRANPVTPQTLLVSRALLEEVGLFDDRLRIHEDWDLAIRLAQRVPFALVEEPHVIIYRTAGSVSSHSLRDAHFREHLLARYAPLFAADPAALSRQHTVAGSLFARNRLHGRAFGHYRKAFLGRPGPRSLARMVLAGVRRAVADRSGEGAHASG